MRWWQALDILKTLEEKDIEKNVVMYNRALKACAVAKDFGKLQEVRRGGLFGHHAAAVEIYR